MPPGDPDAYTPSVPVEERRRRREIQRRRTARQRRIAVAGAVIAGLAFILGVATGAGGGGAGGAGDDAATGPEESPSTLPSGRRRLFPDHRVVAFYGAPQAAELGVLGIGSPDSVARKLERQAKPYATRGRPVLGAFELLAVIAADSPGEGELYRTRQEDAIVRRYLEAARRAKAILLLDIQPGRADFLTETKALERWLAEPDVGLALDPEWRMDPGEIPGQTIGSVDADEVNQVSRYLSELVRRERLPEKLMLVHRFTEDMVERPEAIEEPPGVAVTLNVDGFGTKAQKLAKYRELVPRRFGAGFKLFYREDTGLMTPREVLALRPQPDIVVYE